MSYVKAPGATENGELVSGSTVVKTLDGGYLDSYSFPLTAGDSFEMRVRAANDAPGGFGPRIYIYDPTGRALGSPLNRKRARVAISGSYTAVLADFANSDNGIYYLSYVSTAGPTENDELVSGDTLIRTLDGGYMDSFHVNANSGDSIHFNIANVEPAPSGFKADFHLYAPDGRELTLTSTPSSITKVADQPGNYTLVVFDSSNNASGDYQLYYERTCNLPGDVNLDCELSISDELLLENAILGKLTLTQGQQEKADVHPIDHPDGVIDSSDLLLLNNLLLKK